MMIKYSTNPNSEKEKSNSKSKKTIDDSPQKTTAFSKNEPNKKDNKSKNSLS
jgi:hypothetical protein